MNKQHNNQGAQPTSRSAEAVLVGAMLESMRRQSRTRCERVTVAVSAEVAEAWDRS